MYKRKFFGAFAAAFAFTVAAATAQGQQTPSNPASSKASPRTEQNMKLVGCLMTEPDYRRAHNLGKGALAGAGLGDEFVLVDASSTPAAATDTAANASSSTAAATPSAGSARCTEKGTGQAYRMTGKLERELKGFVGRRVEVIGKFDHERDAKTAAGETNAKLPAEVEIASYREAPASEPATASARTPEPAAAAQARNEPPQAPGNQAPPAETRRDLPRTASNQPLIALIALVSLTAALAVGFVRRLVS